VTGTTFSGACEKFRLQRTRDVSIDPFTGNKQKLQKTRVLWLLHPTKFLVIQTMPQGKLKAKVQLPKGVKQKQKSQKKAVLRKGISLRS
jgi:hypothetical protein